MLSKSFEAEMTATQKTMKKKHTKVTPLFGTSALLGLDSALRFVCPQLAILLFIVVASMLAIGIIAYISVREKRHGGVTPSNSTSNSTVG